MVENLEYRIGGIKINPDRLSFNGSDPCGACHKFVVEQVDGKVTIYIADVRRHKYVADEFRLKKEELVGGGSCYVDRNRQLVLNDFSGDYKAIPKEVAQTFAELLIPELEKQGIQPTGIVAEPSSRIHGFWKDRGFS